MMKDLTIIRVNVELQFFLSASLLHAVKTEACHNILHFTVGKALTNYTACLL